MSAFDAIGHAFSTIATGGYSTHDASIGYFDSALIEGICAFFMLLGGINFAVHFMVWRHRRILQYWRDAEARTYLVLIAVASLSIALTLFLTGTFDGEWMSLRVATFQVISVITSTGFGTESFAHWPLYIPLAIASLSFIGGCAGSTAGGMKVIRIVLLFKQGMRETFRLIHPRSERPIKLGDKPVSDAVMNSVWGFYSLYVLSSLVLTGLMMTAGLDLESAFGAVVASINLLGPGLGEVATNFASVGPAVKWLAVFAMMLGRLEVFTLLVLFTPEFWRN